MKSRQDEGIHVHMPAPCILQNKAGPGPHLWAWAGIQTPFGFTWLTGSTSQHA